MLPGFVNAHYHSHDTLFKGSFETIPLDFWGLYAMPPSYQRRSREELRARTLIGAVECIRTGMTTVQDMDTIYPFHEDDLDCILDAYDEIGLRCVFAAQFADVPKVRVRPYWEEMIPKDEWHRLGASVRQFGDGVDIAGEMERVIGARRRRSSRISFGLGPASPEACTPALWERIVDLSGRENLPIFTHIYQSKGMTLIARHNYQQYGGSLDPVSARDGGARSAAHAGAQRLAPPRRDRHAGRDRHQCGAQPGRQPQDAQRHSPDAAVDERRRQHRPRLRQLQLQRCPEHVPGDEAVRRAGQA